MGATVWLKGLRIPLYWASGAPIVLSAALALREGGAIRPVLWALGSCALLVFEIGVNIVAEVTDKNEGVFVTQENTWIPTGPYLMDRTGIAVEKMLSYAAIPLAAAGLIGLYLAAVTGFVVILAIGLAGFALTLAYASPPLMLGLRGLGEPIPFVSFGPLPGLALYFLLTGQLPWMSVLVTVPAAFWITAVRYAHHLPDSSTRRGARFERMHQARIRHAAPVLALLVSMAGISTLIIYPLTGGLVLLPLAVSAAFSALALAHTRMSAGNAVGVSRGTRYYVLLQIAGSAAMAAALILAQ